MRFLIIALAIAAISMSSCKKDYTCVCKTVDPGVTIKTESNTISAKSKKRATSDCEDGNKTVGTAVTNCTLD